MDNKKLDRINELARGYKEALKEVPYFSLMNVLNFDTLQGEIQVQLMEKEYLELFGATEIVDEYMNTEYKGIKYFCIVKEEEEDE